MRPHTAAIVLSWTQRKVTKKLAFTIPSMRWSILKRVLFYLPVTILKAQNQHHSQLSLEIRWSLKQKHKPISGIVPISRFDFPYLRHSHSDHMILSCNPTFSQCNHSILTHMTDVTRSLSISLPLFFIHILHTDSWLSVVSRLMLPMWGRNETATGVYSTITFRDLPWNQLLTSFLRS